MQQQIVEPRFSLIIRNNTDSIYIFIYNNPLIYFYISSTMNHKFTEKYIYNVFQLEFEFKSPSLQKHSSNRLFSIL